MKSRRKRLSVNNPCNEAFEKWAKPIYNLGAHGDSPPYYYSLRTQEAWEAWRAGWNNRILLNAMCKIQE